MIRLFENASHAHAYAKVRPTTPQKVADIAIEYLKTRNPLGQCNRYSLMVDIGCGSGQSIAPFASYFEEIVGIDPSEKQIEMASKNNTYPNVSYEVGTAENLNFAENVDLVTSGQAIHWMEIGKFFGQCHKVLKPNGCLLIHGYDRPKLYPRGLPDAISKQRALSAEVLLSEFYRKCLFHHRRFHIDDHYDTIFESLNANHKIKPELIINEKACMLLDFLAYLKTWSGYIAFLKKNNDAEESDKTADILDEFIKNLKQKWEIEDDVLQNVPVLVTWDIFSVLSERPFAEQSKANAIE